MFLIKEKAATLSVEGMSTYLYANQIAWLLFFTPLLCHLERFKLLKELNFLVTTTTFMHVNFFLNVVFYRVHKLSQEPLLLYSRWERKTKKMCY